MHYPNFIKKIRANVDGRDFIIGDIHGCYDEVIKLLKYIEFNPTVDRLFSTGDLIDRGPKSLQCLEFLTKEWFFPVLGNHEDILLEKIKKLNNGDTENLTRDDIAYIKPMRNFIEPISNMPLIIEVEHILFDKFYIVHAEILPEHILQDNNIKYNTESYLQEIIKLLKSNSSTQIEQFINSFHTKDYDHILKQKLLWSRKIITCFYEEHKKSIQNQDFSFLDNNQNVHDKIKLFCGHNVVPFPMKIGQQYYLDTGGALGYQDNFKTFDIFSQFGHEFFGISILEVANGNIYNCITNEKQRGKIVKMEKPLYYV